MADVPSSHFDSLTQRQRENLTALERRALQLADWLERDRNEPDKVIAYAQDLRRATWIANDARTWHES